MADRGRGFYGHNGRGNQGRGGGYQGNNGNQGHGGGYQGNNGGRGGPGFQDGNGAGRFQPGFDEARGPPRGGFQGGGRGGFQGGGRGGFDGGGRGGFDGGRGRGFDAPRGGRGGRGGFEGARGGGGRGGGGGGRGPINFTPPNRVAQLNTAANPLQSVVLPSRESTLKQIEEQLASCPDVAKAVTSRAQRPAVGREGTLARVIANHYLILCSAKRLYHYDVSMEPAHRGGDGQEAQVYSARPAKPMSAEISRDVLVELAKKEGWSAGWAFDGQKNIYAATEYMPQHTEKYSVKLEEDDGKKSRLVNVEIKLVATVDVRELTEYGSIINPAAQDAIQALDVALKHGTSLKDRCLTVGRGFYFSNEGPRKSLGGGYEVLKGYQQSLRPTQSGLTVNVDVAATAFLEVRPVLEFVGAAAGVRIAQGAIMPPQDHRAAKKALHLVKVEVAHPGLSKRRYVVKGLTELSAEETTFHNDTVDAEMNVRQYYEHQYGIGLEFPNLPCLNVGNPKKPNYVPMEFCIVSKGQRRAKLDGRQTEAMIKEAAVAPGPRFSQIQKSILQDGNLPGDNTVKAFGLTMGDQMMQVDARMLKAPILQYGNRKTVNPGERGTWHEVEFYNAVSMGALAVASFASEREVGGRLEEWIDSLMRVLVECGMKLPSIRPQVVYHSFKDFPGETVEKAVVAAASNYQVTRGAVPLILVALPGRKQGDNTELYKDIKRATDSFLGIPSQCFIASKAGVMNGGFGGKEYQYCRNLGQKINVKAGGSSVALAVPRPPIIDRGVMVLGADVTHPMGFGSHEPSIAAVVGSTDLNATIFAAQIIKQAHRVEIITGLKGAVQELIKAYRTANGCPPKALVFYRDGVSEGQFAEVERVELPLIRAACLEMSDGKYNPPLTFIVVQKRHHTRFMPVRGGDKNGNVMPGLVVDNGICHPTEFDFYLNSHAGLQGTNRPTHYHVLHDENGFTSDTLQAFTYRQCYLFCRCSRSVSVVPAAYYAHLAAFRGRLMLSYSDGDSEVESVASFKTSGTGPVNTEFAPIHTSLKNRMFYV